MPEYTNSQPPVCSVCGQRPAAVRVMVGGERGSAALCETCARQLMASAGAPRPEQETPATPALDQFGRDLTGDAAAGPIDPAIGRDDEIAQTVQILARRPKNNAVL